MPSGLATEIIMLDTGDGKVLFKFLFNQQKSFLYATQAKALFSGFFNISEDGVSEIYLSLNDLARLRKHVFAKKQLLSSPELIQDLTEIGLIVPEIENLRTNLAELRLLPLEPWVQNSAVMHFASSEDQKESKESSVSKSQEIVVYYNKIKKQYYKFFYDKDDKICFNISSDGQNWNEPPLSIPLRNAPGVYEIMVTHKVEAGKFIPKVYCIINFDNEALFQFSLDSSKQNLQVQKFINHRWQNSDEMDKCHEMDEYFISEMLYKISSQTAKIQSLELIDKSAVPVKSQKLKNPRSKFFHQEEKAVIPRIMKRTIEKFLDQHRHCELYYNSLTREYCRYFTESDGKRCFQISENGKDWEIPIPKSYAKGARERYEGVFTQKLNDEGKQFMDVLCYLIYDFHRYPFTVIRARLENNNNFVVEILGQSHRYYNVWYSSTVNLVFEDDHAQMVKELLEDIKSGPLLDSTATPAFN